MTNEKAKDKLCDCYKTRYACWGAALDSKKCRESLKAKEDLDVIKYEAIAAGCEEFGTISYSVADLENGDANGNDESDGMTSDKAVQNVGGWSGIGAAALSLMMVGAMRIDRGVLCIL